MIKDLQANKPQPKEDRAAEIRKKQNEFLDVYSLYLKTGLRWIKEEAIFKAYELHLLDKKYTFQI